LAPKEVVGLFQDRIAALEAESSRLRAAMVAANGRIANSEQFREGYNDGWRNGARWMREEAAKVVRASATSHVDWLRIERLSSAEDVAAEIEALPDAPP